MVPFTCLYIKKIFMFLSSFGMVGEIMLMLFRSVPQNCVFGLAYFGGRAGAAVPSQCEGVHSVCIGGAGEARTRHGGKGKGG